MPDLDPIQRALAELRAIPTSTGQQPNPDAPVLPPCCTGDRRGYQLHQRTGNLPACEASTQAAAAYMRDYYDRSGRWPGRTHRHAAAQRATA
ncbi:hypothetical protein [Streptomyces sp. NPDC056543]|uniref:hypothetical protein n=1 Tax=unclassified Streptomyces TaxID=2593676 RepID=UPI0036B9323E